MKLIPYLFWLGLNCNLMYAGILLFAQCLYVYLASTYLSDCLPLPLQRPPAHTHRHINTDRDREIVSDTDKDRQIGTTTNRNMLRETNLYHKHHAFGLQLRIPFIDFYL